MTNIKRTISKAYQQLSNFDRVRIETLLNQGFSQARIAANSTALVVLFRVRSLVAPFYSEFPGIR